MGAMPGLSWLPWAVHLSDGVLSAPWLAGGFLLAALLALVGAYRVRDEEIPRIALLSAAFFVASLLHVRLGPTSVHLLLNGLVGVVLGRRAPLAILVGLTLQAALLGHGGFGTLGVNACVLALPALLAGALFSLLRLCGIRRMRLALLWLAGLGIGMTSVLGTLVLDALVLLWGGAEDWHQIISLVFVAHLPIVLIEGIVLGFTVSFLARVKPEMLGFLECDLTRWDPQARTQCSLKTETINRPADELTSPAATPRGAAPSSLSLPPPALLLALASALFVVRPAQAHRLDGGFQVLPNHQVRIEGWFDSDSVPRGARVQVFRPGPELLTEGQLDAKGCFLFPFQKAEPLEIVITAGAGHRKSFMIPREQLERSGTSVPIRDESNEQALDPSSPLRDPDAARRERFKDGLIGISFVLALAAFLLSWRNGRTLASLRRMHAAKEIGNADS